MLSRNPQRRRGNVVVAVAVSLVTLLACVSLSVDGGMLQDKKRQVQAASDAAALAAAGDLYYNWPYEFGADPNGTAYNLAVATAKANGYEDGVNDTSVVVNIPPKSGQFVGRAGYAEVLISFDHPRYFSRVIGTEDIPVPARATAYGCSKISKNAILVLDPSDKSALNMAGGGIVSVTGSAIQVNSNHPEAVIANGGGQLIPTELNITGDYTLPGGGLIDGPIVTGTEPIPDPLAYLPAPDSSTMVVRRTNKLQHSSVLPLIIKPGVYIGGINTTGHGSVIMEPGIYYMMGGGFSFSGRGSLIGHEVMIYNDTASISDSISLSGNNAVSVLLTPPLSGPYQGILFWQERSSTTPIDITGNGNLTLTGTFYAKSAQMNVTGNGLADLIGSQYIVDTLKAAGTGNFSVAWTPETTPRVRIVALVE